MATIRTGKKEDLPGVLELIKELALYERAPHEVTNTVELMEKDGFGPNPIYGFLLRKMKTALLEFQFTTGGIQPGKASASTSRILS